MTKRVLLCGSSVLAAAAVLCATPALAATANTTAADQSPSTVGELVVVATRREEKIESVPVAITALSSQQRALRGIVIFNDLTDVTPGMDWNDTSDRVYIRGIGRNSDNLNNTSGVAIYYNGIYYGANAAVELQKDDLFIGNTEVDRGPQNTLHGSNADGGVVNFQSQKPTDTPYAEVRAGAGNYNQYMVEGVVSGPINDHLKFRFGGNYTQMTGGYFNNLDGPPQGGDLVLGGSGQTHYFEGQLQGHWDHLDIWALASSGDFWANSRGGSTTGNYNNALIQYGTYLPSGYFGLCGLPGMATTVGCVSAANVSGQTVVPGSVKTLPFTANNFPGNNPANVNPRDFIQEFNTINGVQRNLASQVNVTYHAPSFDVTYLGGYQQFHNILEFPLDSDAGVTSYQLKGPAALGNLTIYPEPDFTLFNEYDQSFSNELSISSTTSSPFQYIAGFYEYHEHWNQPVDAGVDPAQKQLQSPIYLTGLPAPANPSSAASTENTEINYDSVAAYAQGTYKFDEHWKVNGAVRYTSDHKAGWQEWRYVDFDGIVTATAAGAATPAFDITSLVACVQAPPKPCLPAYNGAGPATINTATGFVQRNVGETWGAWTGEADVDWTPDPSLLAYLKYARGYKSGGWSTYTVGPDPTVQPEYVDDFEGGVKKIVGSQLTVNVDGFYYNYYGMQVPLSVQTSTPTGPVNTPILYNLPLTHIYGVELDATWHPIDPLILNLGYSYLNSRIAQSACVEDSTEDPIALVPGANTSGCYANAAALTAARAAGGVAQNIVGQAIPQATPNKVSLNGLYTFDFDPGKLTFSATVIWKDATYDGVFNRSYSYEPSYTQVNLRATWNSANGHYTIIAFCDNLLDSLGYDGAFSGLGAAEQVGVKPDILQTYDFTAPRTFGLQVQYRWK